MNERIKELAEQAGYTPLEPRAFADDLQEIFLEKFALLIVRECAKVLEIQGANTGQEQYHYGASLIEEHFGVLE